jgi:hypothetical protein
VLIHGPRVEAISRDVRVMAVGKFIFLPLYSHEQKAKRGNKPGGGSEEIMDQLAIREETKDLRMHAKASAKETKL